MNICVNKEFYETLEQKSMDFSNQSLARTKKYSIFYLLQQEKLSKKENANALNNNENKCTKAME